MKISAESFFMGLNVVMAVAAILVTGFLLVRDFIRKHKRK